MNAEQGIVAILTRNHDFTIIAITADQGIALGDRLSWSNDSALGPQTYRNETKGTNAQVVARNHWVAREQLGKQLQL